MHDAEKRFEDIERLWRKDAILRYVTCNTLEIQVGMERWCIERLGKEDFRLLHNSYLQLLELPCGSTDYVLVCCKAPKWQRRRFYSVMEEVKEGLYRHGYQRGFVAMEVVMQFLTAQGIRVA